VIAAGAAGCYQMPHANLHVITSRRYVKGELEKSNAAHWVNKEIASSQAISVDV